MSAPFHGSSPPLTVRPDEVRATRHAAFFHHQNPVAQGHRFALIMSHENRGDAQPTQKLIQLAAQAFTQLRVQRGQRLVE
ncbi:hypothetical protein A245_34113 [Pseudomonas syringae pv. actinidiae ICMP 19096]|uniref:Uncharacterized protein n=1 Tax=Pseudomonas syringae pv. actinidiae ICMP 19096 TaxID=1194405 RepID=A0A656JQ08_PSESF|nr:hypothetical protein A245_34113 [Pseudomonas syringae pv. actinidiae ICMP 19096]